MQITLESKPFAQLEADALVTYIFEESDPIQGRVSEIDAVTGGLLKKIASSGESTGKTLEFTLIHAPAGLKATRLLLVGAGKQAQFSGATLRKVAGAALRYLKSRAIKNFAFLVREDAANSETAQALAEGSAGVRDAAFAVVAAVESHRRLIRAHTLHRGVATSHIVPASNVTWISLQRSRW